MFLTLSLSLSLSPSPSLSPSLPPSLPPLPPPESLQLTEPQAYHYLNQSGCVSDPTIDDVTDFARVSLSVHTLHSSLSTPTHLLLVLAPFWLFLDSFSASFHSCLHITAAKGWTYVCSVSFSQKSLKTYIRSKTENALLYAQVSIELPVVGKGLSN